MQTGKERIAIMTTAHKKANSHKRTAKLKRKKRLRFCRNLLFACLLAGILIVFGKDYLHLVIAAESHSEKPFITITDYTQAYAPGQHKDDPIPSPASEPDLHRNEEAFVPDNRRIMEDEESEIRLAELAMQDPDIAEIYTHREDYPERLLMALSVNAEMKDFVKGYLTAGCEVTGEISSQEASKDFPLFLQWDARWGYVPYGGMNIGVSGCGPTCLSMVIYALTRDASATPDTLSAYAMNNGYYLKGTGTTWALMTDAPALYGLRASELGLDEAEMKYWLDRGCPIICSMRPGDFTLTGHFIVLYGYDKDGFLVNDPNSLERSSRHWDYDTLHYQIKNLWCYSKA